MLNVLFGWCTVVQICITAKVSSPISRDSIVNSLRKISLNFNCASSHNGTYSMLANFGNLVTILALHCMYSILIKSEIEQLSHSSHGYSKLWPYISKIYTVNQMRCGF